MKTVRLTTAELLALPEYSCTVPTGTTIGKKWRRHQPYRRYCKDGPCEHWWLGEYAESEREGYVDIKWAKVVVSDLPLPPRQYQAWSPEVD